MKQFYLEMAETKQIQLDMARVGYARKCHEIASKLMSCTVNESYPLIKELNETSSAYRQLEVDYENLMKRYQEEVIKEVNDKEEKEDV